MSIRLVIPTPTPVTLAGRPFLASELRLRDVAGLQGWLDARLPSPFDAAAGVLEGGDRSPAWVKLLSDVIDAQEAWPREPGTPEADALLASPDGCRMLLALALRREHPGLSGADVAALHAGASRGEFARLARVAWGSDPLRAMADLIDGPAPDDGGPGPDWAGLWHRWITEAPNGPPFDQLTITQFRVFRCGGELPPAGAVDPSRPDWHEVAERRRKFFEGLEGPPGDN